MEHPVYIPDWHTRGVGIRVTEVDIYMLYMYIFLGAHALRVREMAWPNEAATRQVLSILSDTRSCQPTSKRSRCRVYVTLALLRAA